jgi:fibronectin-binding autotransporter adhesin
VQKYKNKITHSLLMKTKSTSQTPRKFTKKNALLLTVTALALCAWPAVALATDCLPQTTWVDRAGSWFTAANWNNGVPASGTAALINNGGTAQISASLPVANACALTLGLNAGDSGNISVSIGTLQVTTTVVVGSQGAGSLTVTNGGTVTSGGEADVGGTSSTATGQLKVTDSGTVTAASAHVYDSGTLTGNGTVSTTSGTTVDGTLSPSGRLTIGGAGGLQLDSGATMTSNVVPASADNVNVTPGAATLQTGSKVSVTMTGNFTPGTTYTLLHADGLLHGQFSYVSINYPTCECFAPKITYDAHNVYLYLDPVPCCQ